MLILLPSNSTYAQISDSTANDTIKVLRFIDHEITYKAKDSMRLSIKEQKVYLYGTAYVKYGDIELTAGLIEYDFKKKQVQALPRLDSLGEKIEFPSFTDGKEKIEAKKISYNFDSKKAYVQGSRAKQGEGYIHFDETKVYPNKDIHGKSGKYTTCDAEEPHYYFHITKAIVIPEDKIVAGPLMLYIADIPTPLALPFGFFPNNRNKGAGLIIPSYDNTINYGSGLLNGGYYFPYKDKADLQLTGSIYTKGTWGLRAISRYKSIYKYSGSLNLTFQEYVTGDKDLPTLTSYGKTKSFAINWQHVQDPKARPNSSFNANVNYNSNQRNDIQSQGTDFLNNSFNSSIAYQKTIPNSPFSFNISALQTQTAYQKTNDNSKNYNQLTLTLPDVNLSMNRIYPFKSIQKEKQSKFIKELSKIYLTYNSQFKNSVSFIDTAINIDNVGSLINKSQNGVQHNISSGTSIKLLNRALTINPSFRLTERWYFQELSKTYIALTDEIINDTLRGVGNWNRAMTGSVSVSASSKFYGMYRFAGFAKGKRMSVFRHVLTPTLGFSYTPKFDSYIDSVYNSSTNSNDAYSKLQLGIYGVPQNQESGNLSLGLNNSLEMKMKVKTDTGMVYKKYKLIESFTARTSYNLLADSLNLNTISLDARTTLFKMFSIYGFASLNPYQKTDSGVTINKFLINKGKLAKMNNASLTFSFNLNQDKFKQKVEETEKNSNATNPELERIKNNPNDYVDFEIPWNFSFSYTFNARNYFQNYRDTTVYIQSATINGDLNLTPNWKIGFNMNYDITNKQLSYTSLNIHRQLHCWEMKLNWIPFGPRQSYNFQINVKSSVLSDLKFNKRKTWFDN